MVHHGSTCIPLQYTLGVYTAMTNVRYGDNETCGLLECTQRLYTFMTNAVYGDHGIYMLTIIEPWFNMWTVIVYTEGIHSDD